MTGGSIGIQINFSRWFYLIFSLNRNRGCISKIAVSTFAKAGKTCSTGGVELIEG